MIERGSPERDDGTWYVAGIIHELAAAALEASNGRAALEVSDEQPVDLVLLDIGLPEIDGFEVLASLREDFELSQLPVVMLTGRDSEQEVLRALEMGANDYITKDTDFQIALARMETQLRLRHARRRLVEIARTDALTQVLNRRAFFEEYERTHQRYVREGTPYSLLMIDLDHFKQINDTYGHTSGDEVLRRCAQRLREANQSSDVVARFGGEEFVVLLPETPYRKAAEAGERVRERIAAEPVALTDTRVDVTVSVGFASQRADSGDPPGDVLERADAAVYAAKNDGRNCVRGARQ